MDSKLNAVVDLGGILFELIDELKLRRESNGGAVQRLLIQDYEALNVVYFLWHRDEKLLVFCECVEIIIKSPHPSHLHKCKIINFFYSTTTKKGGKIKKLAKGVPFVELLVGGSLLL